MTVRQRPSGSSRRTDEDAGERGDDLARPRSPELRRSAIEGFGGNGIAAAGRRVARERWGREDSNLRRLSRRVYSPFPLAARAHPLGSGPHCSLRAVERFDVLVVGGGPAGSATAHHLAAAGAFGAARRQGPFPRDKPCGGGLTTRAFLRCPVDPTPVVEETGRRRRAAVPLPRSRRAARARAGDLDDAAAPARCLSPRRRARAGSRGARRRARRDRRRDQDRRTAGRGRCRSSVPTEQMERLRVRSVSATASFTVSRSKATSPTGASPATATRAARSSSWATSPAATAGSSRRATTSTWASASGRRRGRTCASTSARRVRRTGSSPTTSKLCGVIAFRYAGRGRASPASAGSSSATPPG